MRLNIATKAGKSVAEQLSAERLVNMYAEAAPADAKSQVVVHGSHGLDLFATCGNGPIRGMKRHEGLLYVVSGTTLYSVDSNGTAVSRGTITGSERVGMASNGTYLCIVTGTGNTGYLYGLGAGLFTITDTDFGGANTVDQLNGYFIFGDGTPQFFINTTPFNGVNYDALDFATAEADPDGLVRPFVDHKELMLFGEKTMEPWSGSTGAFAFEAIVGAVSEKGLASRWAVDQIDNTVFWLDQNGVVRRMDDGYSPQRISTHEVEAAFGESSSAEAFAYVERGHEFFCITFDTGTWLYDAATGLWHERESWQKGRWRARFQEFIFRKNIVGDFEGGNLYALNSETFTENGVLLVSEMVFPPINMDGEKFKLSRLQLDLEQGEGGGEVRLWLSNDGLVWRNAGTRSMGATGDRDARTIWRNLGQHRNLHLKFSFSDNVRRAVFAAYATLT